MWMRIKWLQIVISLLNKYIEKRHTLKEKVKNTMELHFWNSSENLGFGNGMNEWEGNIFLRSHHCGEW